MTILEEAIRYLGYKGAKPSEEVVAGLTEAIEEVRVAAVPKHIYKAFPVKFKEDGAWIETYAFPGQTLAKHIADCEQAVLLAATLGVGVDRLLRKYSVLNLTKAVYVQAAAAALLEEYCDGLQKELEAYYQKQGLYVLPRFSPGYGDLPLESQRALFALLKPQKQLGLMLTDNFMMVPEKSVTAIVGVSKVQRGCHKQGCAMCGHLQCSYRRAEGSAT